MSKRARYIFFSLLISFYLNGCSSNNDVHSSKAIFKYDNSVIGDNNAVTNIVGQLQHSKEFSEVSLQTKTEPYGMTLTYNEIEARRIEKEYKETAVYNATFLFALVDNAEWITFDFEDREYKITKRDLQNWYGKKLSEFTYEEELKSFVQEQLKDETKVNQLLK